MSWFVFAAIGHLLNGVAFVIDKALLTSAFKRSATYAGFIGGLSAIAIIGIPWIHAWPSLSIWPAVIGFGALFVFGLWVFFEALRRSEATRVVPLVGALVPLMTFIQSSFFFQEHLIARSLIGLFALILATWMLTIGTKLQPTSWRVIGLCAVSGWLFATATLCGKYAFDRGDFVGVLVASRLVAGLVGICIIVMQQSVRMEIGALFVSKQGSRLRGDDRTKGSSIWIKLAPLFGQLCGAIGFVLIHIAIRTGSVSIVNALQAVQYAFLVIAALALRSIAPRLLGEDLSRKALIIKGGALVVTALGLYLVA